VRTRKLHAIIALIALSAFMLVAGSRVVHNQTNELTKVISKATVADHGTVESPGFIVVSYVLVAAVMPFCGYVYSSDTVANPCFHVSQVSIRPPPVAIP
jgi:predicted class III extradiol MEMO1 family dioxygenase